MKSAEQSRWTKLSDLKAWRQIRSGRGKSTLVTSLRGQPELFRRAGSLISMVGTMVIQLAGKGASGEAEV